MTCPTISPLELPCGAVFFFDDEVYQVNFDKTHYWKLVGRLSTNEFNEIDYDTFETERLPQVKCCFCDKTTRVQIVQVQEIMFNEIEKRGRGRPKKEKRNTRSPTDYNKFVKNILISFRTNEETKEKLNNKENMKRAAGLWNIIKEVKEQSSQLDDTMQTMQEKCIKIHKLYKNIFGDELTTNVMKVINDFF